MKGNVSFIEALSILSKSSPFAVSTENSGQKSSLLNEIKEYLYIQSPVEEKVLSTISSLSTQNKKILFLCGSSGDGKSEILTRCKKTFDSRVRFHLDATHSFDPNENAIQTLDREIESYLLGDTPLVIGINTGMLANYAEEGANENVAQSIKAYLDRQSYSDEFIFINFEDFPKFLIGDNEYHAEFPEKFLKRITQQKDNILRQLYDRDKANKNDVDSKRLFANYELLSLPSVQAVIIDLLFKARLKKDQFLTARALLDFVFGLLAGPGYLFDNLFSGGDNELAEKIAEFDPANLRTKQIDRFILAFELKLTDSDFEDFREALMNIDINNVKKAHSYLRLFYALRYGNYANNYHAKFRSDFSESLIEKYIHCYKLHRDFNGDKAERELLKNFYNKTLIQAVRKHINRNAPYLSKNQYLTAEVNGYLLTSKLDIKPDYKSIQNDKPQSASYFNVHLKVKVNDSEVKIRPIPLNINLLGLLIEIVSGFRPNKHDKSSIVILDELVDDITKVANQSHDIQVVRGRKRFELRKVEDDDIEVSEV
ncbi:MULTISPECIES: DNA phosphorothioation-dependent restriction protein DptF [Alteromonas]|uniref:DNA phosphorothioation-dependent restriction protein DptF n=1 Tax=Alteromonas stellipolaris TaxID=233316 RepID=A0AAW7Z2K0_9ALTE|nr:MULTISPECIES: DNA phosphorothioation-dependent restriction protein DptF [Alteromonas]AMJ85187.1 DNA phosphorothioation-dependent restriction protein DptF [Alteromonas sp. Mac1]AMJ89073.1 DNA phosphorothioation-dependent restriction protein DptF [Alteromonas sp. Mac2]MDO6577614.1 DNA phosphorothioation-dependent restriction protein DptF [Alteromonas stellipolaris]